MNKFLFALTLLAGTTLAAMPAYAQAGTGGSFVAQLLPLLLIFLFFWLLLIRPQQKKLKAHREMVSNLKRSDEVVTSGGIIGSIEKVVNDDEVLVKIDDKTTVRVVRSTISTVMSKPVPAKTLSATKPSGANTAAKKPAKPNKKGKAA